MSSFLGTNRQRFLLLVAALASCAGCRHTHGHAPTRAEDAGLTGSSALQGDAAAEPNRLCTRDASACPDAACSSAADCAPVACMQAECMDAVCSYGTLPAGSPCGTGKVCSQSGACADCVPGTQRCAPGSATLLDTCAQNGSWQRTTCEGQACFNAQCTGQCEPGSSTCEAGRERRCGVDGRFSAAVSCATGSCESDACAGECEPGQARCLDLYRMQTCSGTGSWGPISACNAQPCDVARGGCLDACAPGTNRCREDTIAQCQANGQWGPAVACPNGCTARGCNACRPGSHECVDAHNARSCSEDGTWQTSTPCPVVCAQGQCMACEPGTALCPSPDQRELIQFCKPDGTLKAVEGCRPHAHCIGGKGNTCPCDEGYRASGQGGDANAGNCVPIR